MIQLKWEYTLALLFVACSVLVIILMTVQANYSNSRRASILQEIENVQNPGFSLQEVPGTNFRQHEITDYTEMLERPLFFDERRPIVPQLEEEGDKATAEVEIKLAEDVTQTLIGVIDTPVGVYALFHDPRAKPDQPKFLRLKQGQGISGWLIKEIKHDRVIITADGNVDEILLAKPREHKASKDKKRKTNPFKRKIKK